MIKLVGYVVHDNAGTRRACGACGVGSCGGGGTLREKEEEEEQEEEEEAEEEEEGSSRRRKRRKRKRRKRRRKCLYFPPLVYHRLSNSIFYPKIVYIRNYLRAA